MKKGLILLSGGQDSATCLAWARNRFDEIHTIAFDYGQRHRVELDRSRILSGLAKADTHAVLEVSSLQQLGNSALLNQEEKISDKHSSNDSLPASFVPGRNMLFLTLAAARAYQLKIHHLVTGVCQTDFSGYPDCRDTSIKAVQVALFSCLDYGVNIHTPLMWKTKAETVLMMKRLGHLDWYKHTHTCYEGKRPPCNTCPACKLRARGFREAGVKDPIYEN